MSNQTNRRIAIAAIIIAILFIAIYYVESQSSSTKGPSAFELDNKTYQITGIALTLAQQEQGLMNTNVTNRTFLLFSFGQPAVYTFWMKDTYTQLDIIWLNYNASTGMARVVYYVNATPCVNYDKDQNNCNLYTPTALANYVLETKDGFVQSNKIVPGTEIRFIYT